MNNCVEIQTVFWDTRERSVTRPSLSIKWALKIQIETQTKTSLDISIYGRQKKRVKKCKQEKNTNSIEKLKEIKRTKT